MEQQIKENPFEGKITAVLNGGKNELDSAIVPFTFGFSDDVIEKNPTHVLIIDRTFTEAKYEELHLNEVNETIRGKRYFIDLSQPGNNFIEFFKSGEHNLLFVFYNFSYKSRKEIASFKDWVLEKSKYYKGQYEIGFRPYQMVKTNDERIAICEKDVYIPLEFFSQKPQGIFGKTFYNWVNQWRRESPADQCEFRDRALRALTYELIPRILWLIVRYFLYFIFRFLVSTILSFVLILLKSLFFIFGVQNKKFFAGFKELWNDYLLKEEDLEDAVNKTDIGECYSYKEIVFKGKTYYAPFSIAGALIWMTVAYYFTQSLSNDILKIPHLAFTLLCSSFLIIQSCIIIETSNFVKKLRTNKLFTKKYRFDGNYYDLYTIISILSVVASFTLWIIYSLYRIKFFSWLFAGIFSKAGLISFFIIALIFCAIIVIVESKKIWSTINDKLDVIIYKFESKWQILMDKFDLILDKYFPQKEYKAKEKPADTYKGWLKNNYNLNNAPKTITASTLPKAQTASGRVVQTFKSKFWDTKAKICKPYEN